MLSAFIRSAPNGFRWKIVPERNDSGKLEEGMITTDEPGVYIEGKYGIRTENELICVLSLIHIWMEPSFIMKSHI